MPLTTELVSLTMRHRESAIADAIFTGVPAFNLIKAVNPLNLQGGTTIITQLEYAKNGTVAAFSGTDVIDTTKQTVFTSAEWDWRYVAGTVTITVEEKAKNNGPEQVVDLLRGKERNLVSSFQDKMETYLFAAQPASGSKDPNSLTELVDVDPTGDPPRANVGGITTASSANTWWRNRTVPLDVDTTVSVGGTYDFATNAQTYMRRMWNACSQSGGMEEPDLVVTTQEVYEAYEAMFPPQLVLTVESRNKADLGFRAFEFKGAPMIFSKTLTGGTGTTANKLYMLNRRHLRLVTHTDWNFKMGDFIEPSNQAAMTAKMIWSGNFVCTNRLRQGVIEGFTV